MIMIDCPLNIIETYELIKSSPQTFDSLSTEHARILQIFFTLAQSNTDAPVDAIFKESQRNTNQYDRRTDAHRLFTKVQFILSSPVNS